MSGVKDVILRGYDTLAKDGMGAFLRKAKNSLEFQTKVRIQKILEKKGTCEIGVKDVLFVNGCELSHPQRYRVDHQIEQLEACGLTVDKIYYLNVTPDMAKFYRAIAIFRCPITEEVRELVDKAHYFNKKVFYDIDDLVIDTKYTDTIKYVQQMGENEKRGYDDGVKRMGETMSLCDYCITTTPALARELRKYGKEVFVNRNVMSEEMVKLSLEAVEKAQKGNKVRIGYLSGSITHNPDFEMIEPAIVRIMEEFPEVELLIMGYLDLPKDLEKFSERIVQENYADWRNLPEIIAGLDINLAPIEKTVFNEAKSENKWTEAALCRVVTVASDFGAFREVIEDGETGMLCKNTKDWYEKLKKLVTNAELRREIGKKAQDKVLKEYVSTYTGMGLAKFIESRLAKNIAFVMPSTNISGGVLVALRHCDILRTHGWDVTIYNLQDNDTDAKVGKHYVNTISARRHAFSARFDEMVATMYSTLENVLTYPKVRTRKYLVQNFETDFYGYGDSWRKVANGTYNCRGEVEYLTISKWCKKWLQDRFGQEAKFAPNGIDAEQFKWKRRSFKGKVKVLIEGNSESEYKNVDESFRITNRLDRNKYEVVYLSYGAGAKAWYKVDKFYNKVPYDEVADIYRECDILLKTSLLESFSYPPLEMMATGGFVVALANEGNVEYLADGENCLFYERGNIDDVLEKIERIAKSKALRDKLTAGAKKTVTGRNWAEVEADVLKLYQ